MTVFHADTQEHSLKVTRKLREAGIKTEMSFKSNKLAKQFKEAHKRNIPNVVVIGPDDIEAGTIQWKNMISGEQKSACGTSFGPEWLRTGRHQSHESSHFTI